MTTSLAVLSPPAIVDTTTLGVPSAFFENVKVPVWPSSYIRFQTPTRSLKLSGACAIAGAAVTINAAESSHGIAVFIGTSCISGADFRRGAGAPQILIRPRPSHPLAARRASGEASVLKPCVLGSR